jgi:hypothetical protein
VDWALTIDTSLPIIREQVLGGIYVPLRPTRSEAGKSKGAFRVHTALNIRDALVYRHICDQALLLALPHKVEGAFFSRRQTPTPVGKSFGYEPSESDEFYAIWLRYNEYRSKTLLNQVYKILVITDISNYFESIAHDLLFEYLAPLGLPRKAVGTLGRLLEAFRPDAGNSPSPRLGIPVDDLDCSRELAHIFLFEHDRRIVEAFGVRNYVRWMDDQNIGVRTMAEGRSVVNAMTRSLAQQRLTLNSEKTRFLTPTQVAAHFQLEANDELTKWWERLVAANWHVSEELRTDLSALWQGFSQGETAEKGNWDKILKRFYAYAARANLDFLEAHSILHLVRYPDLAERIFHYLARRNRGQKLLDIFVAYVGNDENLFEHVESQFFEALLLLDPDKRVSDGALAIATAFAKKKLPGQTPRSLGRASAILTLYWLGARTTALQQLYSAEEASELPKEVARAWLTVVAARTPARVESVVERLFGHPADDVLRLVRFLQSLRRGQLATLGKYYNLKNRYPLPGKFYDARAWLLLEVASHSKHPTLRASSSADAKRFAPYVYTAPERRILARVSRRLGLPG